jgi:hypothetical protein
MNGEACDENGNAESEIVTPVKSESCVKSSARLTLFKRFSMVFQRVIWNGF